MHYSSDENRAHKYINFLTLNANLGAIVSGMLFITVNTCFAEILRELNSEQTHFRDFILLSITLPFGSMFGALIGSFIANKFGRRKTMICADLLTIIGTFFSIDSNLGMMLFGRLICGFATGINFMVIPLYVREISPPEMSGRMGSDFRISFSIGLFIPMLISIGLLLKENPNFWKIIMLTPCLLSCTRIFNFLKWIQMDTPQYYIEKNEEANAIAVLEKIFEGDRVDQIHHREKKFEIKGFFEVFGKKYKKQVIIVTLLIFAVELMGSNSLNFYTTAIFAENSESGEEGEVRLWNILFMISRLVASIVGKSLVDKAGRKPLIIYGTIASIIVALSMVVCDVFELNLLQDILLILYTVVQGLTLSLVLPIYASELLPSFGVALQVVIQMFSIMIVTILFPNFGVACSFLLFAVIGIVTLFPISRLTKETKGKTLNEVYMMFHAGTEGHLSDDYFDEADTLTNFDSLHII